MIPGKLNTPKKKKGKKKDQKKKKNPLALNSDDHDFNLDPSLGIVKEESKEQSTILRSKDYMEHYEE